MALTLCVEGRALLLKSEHFFWKMGRVRVRIPRWLIGMTLIVGHIDCGDGWFAFTLDVRQGRFGPLIYQTAMFHDTQ